MHFWKVQKQHLNPGTFFFNNFRIRATVPMRVADAGEGEGRATVAAYDWLTGGGETSSGLSSSLGSTGSSLESNSLYE